MSVPCGAAVGRALGCGGGVAGARDRRGGGRRGAALDHDRELVALQGHIFFLQRIEVSEDERRHGAFPLVRREHHLKSLRSADPDLVLRLEIRARRIGVPAARVLQGRRGHPVEIPAAGDGRGHGERVADLRVFRFHIGREREIPDRAGKGGGGVGRERLNLDRGRSRWKISLPSARRCRRRDR